MTPIFVILPLLFISLFALGYTTLYRPQSNQRITYKVICSFLFILLASYALPVSAGFGDYAKFLTLALSFSLGGDIVLAFADRKSLQDNRLLPLGILLFASAQIFYISGFLSLTHWPSLLLLVLPLLMLVAFYVVTNREDFHFYGHKHLIGIYVFLLTLMVVIAIYIAFTLQTVYALLITCGAILFVFSDLVLCIYYFHHDKRQGTSVFNLVLYYTAQILLALSLYFLH